MVVAILTVELHFPSSGSLKHKRHLLRGFTDRLKNRFNVAVAEVGERDLWQRATLGLAHVNTDRAHADAAVEGIRGLFDGEHDLQVLDFHVEFL